jgi:succinate dehydrogenase / fumarate reductase iron-sulfur subunit
MQYTFKIMRFDPQIDEFPYFEEFPFEAAGKKSVLEALMEIRNNQDCTLAFRYSCREAICGACAMVINGKFDLACRTMVEALNTSVIIVEPLPNLEIQKDLLVDMSPFWEAVSRIGPYLFSGDQPEGGYRIEDKVMERIEQYTNCILCACCYSVCPVVARDERYVGAAALAKLCRFVQDPRDKRPYPRLAEVNAQGGVWSCDTVLRCNEVCPKSVRPADGIEALRRKLLIEKLKRVFRKRP